MNEIITLLFPAPVGPIMLEQFVSDRHQFHYSCQTYGMTMSLPLGSGTFMTSPICLASFLVILRLILQRPSATMGDDATLCARLRDMMGEWWGLTFSLASLRT